MGSNMHPEFTRREIDITFDAAYWQSDCECPFMRAVYVIQTSLASQPDTYTLRRLTESHYLSIG